MAHSAASDFLVLRSRNSLSEIFRRSEMQHELILGRIFGRSKSTNELNYLHCLNVRFPRTTWVTETLSDYGRGRRVLTSYRTD